MLIVLEGPLGVGKSSLAEEISTEILRRYPGDTVEIRRPGIPRLHPLDEYVMPLLDYRPQRKHHIVCDGWHWAEVVYSTVFGRASTMYTSVFHYIEMFLASRGAHIVSLVADAVDLADQARARGYGDPMPEIAIQRTITGYMGVLHLSALPSQEMHVESENLAASIVSTAHSREMAATPLSNLATYVGPPTVDTLVLGNVRGPGKRHELAPAFMPYPFTCGEFLMEALCYREPGTTPRTMIVGLANARDVDSLEEIKSTVWPTRIVALGERAYGAARDVFLPVCNVGHPVSTRKFFGRTNSMAYGQMIQHTLHELDRRH